MALVELDGERDEPPRRVDARRNQRVLLEAAAAVFVASGVQAPIRDIAAAAGMGTATIYRHFPTRAQLIVAVYRHQVQSCADAGRDLLVNEANAFAALELWVDLFVDFLVTKRGLASALRSDDAGLQALHSWFLDTLVPVCADLLEATAASGETCSDIEAHQLMRGIGNLCIGDTGDHGYDARRLVALLLSGLRRH